MDVTDRLIVSRFAGSSGMTLPGGKAAIVDYERLRDSLQLAPGNRVVPSEAVQRVTSALDRD